MPSLSKPTRLPHAVVDLIATVLLVALSACGGNADDIDDAHPAIRPVDCSAASHPCA